MWSKTSKLAFSLDPNSTNCSMIEIFSLNSIYYLSSSSSSLTSWLHSLPQYTPCSCGGSVDCKIAWDDICIVGHKQVQQVCLHQEAHCLCVSIPIPLTHQCLCIGIIADASLPSPSLSVSDPWQWQTWRWSSSVQAGGASCPQQRGCCSLLGHQGLGGAGDGLMDLEGFYSGGICFYLRREGWWWCGHKWSLCVIIGGDNFPGIKGLVNFGVVR